MFIQIKNFRGCAAASIDLDKIALVAGNNHQGKTSIAQCIGGALAGKAIPIDKLPKKQIGRLVHGGTACGTVMVKQGDDSVKITYPEAEIETLGRNPPTASVYATGLETILKLDAKNRVKLLNEYLGTLPTKEDLAKALADTAENQEELVDNVWGRIQASGWDAAHAVAKDKGTALKSKWEEVTGERYGSRKAESWQPAAWTHDLASKTRETLVKELEAENQWLESAIGHNAVSETEIERAQIVVADKTAVENLLKLARNNHKVCKETRDERQIKLQTMKLQGQKKTHECPHCKGDLEITAEQTIRAAVKEDGVDLKKQEAERARLEKDFIDFNKETAKHAAEIAKFESSLYAIKQAEELLAKAEAQPEEDGTAQGVEDCRKRVEVAKANLATFDAYTTAESTKRAIVINTQLIKVLEPKGMRLEKLKKAVRVFNQTLAWLCNAGKWAAVEISEDMDITYNGAHVGEDHMKSLCSESEWRMAFITFQLAMAKMDKSACVIIDGADVFDNNNRNGLMGAVINNGVPAIIMAKMEREDYDITAPKINSFNGKSYWISGGKFE